MAPKLAVEPSTAVRRRELCTDIAFRRREVHQRIVAKQRIARCDQERSCNQINHKHAARLLVAN